MVTILNVFHKKKQQQAVTVLVGRNITLTVSYRYHFSKELPHFYHPCDK